MAVRIEVGYNEAAGHTAAVDIAEDLGISSVESLRVVDVYTVDADLSGECLERAREELFTDPVTQESAIGSLTYDADFAVAQAIPVGIIDLMFYMRSLKSRHSPIGSLTKKPAHADHSDVAKSAGPMHSEGACRTAAQ